MNAAKNSMPLSQALEILCAVHVPDGRMVRLGATPPAVDNYHESLLRYGDAWRALAARRDAFVLSAGVASDGQEAAP